MTPGPSKQFDRDEALDRAMRLFWEQGYNATGISDLTDHMGIGRQSLYDTFGDKKALYKAALDHYFRQRLAITREVLHAPGSPIGNLKSLFAKMIEISEATGHCGCFIGNSVAEIGERDDELPRVLSRFFDEMEKEFRGVLERARNAGELDPGAPIEGIARLLLTTTQGLALMSKIEPGRRMADSVLEAAFSMMRA